MSDGLGFYVEPFLSAMGAPDLPVATSVMDFSTAPFGISFPYGHPRCFVCGTCKRERVLAHRAAGRYVAFVGDGESDRYGAWHADLVFAKHRLADLCEREGWPYIRWERFADVGEWLREGLASGAVPATPESLAALRAVPRSEAELAARRGDEVTTYICGPEAWGPWRVAPGPAVVASSAREPGRGW